MKRLARWLSRPLSAYPFGLILVAHIIERWHPGYSVIVEHEHEGPQPWASPVPVLTVKFRRL